ncbi:MAG: hypothetical protein U0790_08980 [Isosphaeraceae bacterium]
MAGVGKFKLTDALPKHVAETAGESNQAGPPVKGKPAAKSRSKKSTKGKAVGTHEQAAEQVREARESARAKNAEASIRGHMVDIGRGNQQAGRQKAK